MFRFRSLFPLVLLVMFCVLLASCSDSVDPVEEDPEPEPVDLLVDDGDLGVVIDTREIFRKGYVPTTARIMFGAHGNWDTELPIDPVTNLAILILDKDDLDPAEIAACEAGVSAAIVITDADEIELAVHAAGELVLDDSNIPLALTTELPYVPQPVVLRADLPYLLQIEGKDNLVQLVELEEIFPDEQYDPVNPDIMQKFWFVPVAGADPGTYMVENLGYEPGTCWTTVSDGDTWLRMQIPWDAPAQLVVEGMEDGWARIRLAGTDLFMAYGVNVPGAGNVFRFVADDYDRFRLISDAINWNIADRGTHYNQPIMPPARLDFAYETELHNCSGATLEQTVGREEKRSHTTTVGTTESLQLFASASLTLGAKIGYSVTAKVGVDIQGIGEAGTEQTVSGEASVETNVTTSATTTAQQMWQATVTEESAVSYERTVSVPPQTAVNVYDAVKTIDDVIIPYTQTLRITATDDLGAPLTGREIRSQMMFNFVGGVVSAVGDFYLDMTFRGEVQIDQLFKSTSNVEEIEGGCG